MLLLIVVWKANSTVKRKMNRRALIRYISANKIALILLLLLTYLEKTCANNFINIEEIVEGVATEIDRIKNDELGVAKLYSNIKYVNTKPNLDAYVIEMAERLEKKIFDAFTALDKAKDSLEDRRSFLNLTEIPAAFIPCLQQNTDKKVYKLIANALFSDDSNRTINQLDTGYVLQKMRHNMESIREAVKQQYFITDTDVKSSSSSPFSWCTSRDDTILWKNYMYRNNYVRKNVILVVDHGGSLSKTQLEIVKTVSKQLIAELEDDDRIALITIASDWFALANSSNCLLPNQVAQYVTQNLPTLKFAENSHKNTLYTVINSLQRGNGATNHTLGLEKALQVINMEKHKLLNETTMILYVSRGLLSSLTEAKSILQMIAKYTDHFHNDFVINTCAVIDESKPIMYETHFLRDIAEQNYNKFNVSFKLNKRRKMGLMLSINSTDSVGFTASHFYTIFNPNSSYKIDKQISLPTWDPINNDQTISLTISWFTNDIFAMLGVDIDFFSLIEDIKYFSNGQENAYAFLMNKHGKVLNHPSLSTVKNNLYYVDVSRMENELQQPSVRSLILNNTKGFYITENNSKKYIWHHVAHYFIICLVTKLPYSKSIYKSSISNNKLIYQNLDKNYKLCRHFSEVATLEAASLHLSISCFQSPFQASISAQDKVLSQGYLVYLKDDTGLLANPGLKDEVRDQVATLTHIIDFQRRKHFKSNLTKYIVRRYVASSRGVLEIFPGINVNPGFDPTRRPWFIRAIQHKGRVVFVAPYLDGGGAGYVVTVAYANAHNIVVAIDFTFGYIFKLLLNHMPFCTESKIRCFLMDDQGYLIYHPDLLSLNYNNNSPLEQQHIVHKESSVASDILNHKLFIKKLLCNNYGDSTIQRYYQLNVSYEQVLSNSVPGDHCNSYRIKLVPNTNVFLGFVNTSCNGVAFCPCSVVDRLCLNCNRMEQNECECPCECPLNIDTEMCRVTNRNITDNEACLFYPDNEIFISNTTTDLNNLEACLPINNCRNEETFQDCLGLTGCEWCMYDIDNNYLRKPFCSSNFHCFNGVLGSVSPYKNSHFVEEIQDSDFSPVGPVLGSIIAMCVLLVLLFICYRSYTTISTDRLYLSSTQDNHLRMSDLHVDNNYHDLGNHRDKLLQEEKPDPVSPYCVASNYRRAAATADSDHGYSTMTPHDESEHLSLAPVEVDSLEDDLTSDNASIHTSVSTNKHHDHLVSPPMFTRLPNRNCIVVPVTVHRNMEPT